MEEFNMDSKAECVGQLNLAQRSIVIKTPA